MKKWFMLTLVGKDSSGIVAHITQCLLKANCNLGEASMIRLGVNFTIMLMVEFDGSIEELKTVLTDVTHELELHQHIDEIDGELHQHQQPDVGITVYGADRSGIVARVAQVLADADVNILQLESSIGGSEEKPIYIMQIEGHAVKGIEPVQAALDAVKSEGIDVALSSIDTLVG